MDQYGNYIGNNSANKHQMMVRNRESLDITGVKKIESLNQDEFILETVMGYMSVLGEGLEMKSVNIDKGEMSIQGYVTCIEYFDDNNSPVTPKKEKTFLSKIFK